MQENEIGTPAPAERGGTALVTGANSGIGREIARQLLALGWTVHIGARDRARGQAAVDELGSGAQLALIDATDASSIAAAASAVEHLDVLVNNAGITDEGSPAPQASVDTFRRVYETNVFGVVAVTNAFLPALGASEDRQHLERHGVARLEQRTQSAVPVRDRWYVGGIPLVEDRAQRPHRLLRPGARA